MKLTFSAQVFIVGVILSMTFFLLSIDIFKTYYSSVTILVIEKSGVAVQGREEIVSNIAEFPKMLSFYESLLRNNSDVKDVTFGRSQDQRKKLWNNMVSVERSRENSSLIKVSILANNESEADQLAKKIARNLFDTTSKYYDIKEDVDVRLVDGPISHSRISFWYLLIPISMLLGFSVAILLQYAFSQLQARFSVRNNFLKGKQFFDFKKDEILSTEKEITLLEELYKAEQADATIVSQEKNELPLEVQEMKRLTKKIEADKYPNFPEMPVRSAEAKVSAPDNLPIADDSFFMNSNPNVSQEKIASVEEEIVSQEESVEEPKIHEPTPEELKARLNQLLRGEL